MTRTAWNRTATGRAAQPMAGNVMFFSKGVDKADSSTNFHLRGFGLFFNTNCVIY